MKKIKTNVSNKGTEGLIIIGGVHGKVNRYWDIIKTHKGTSIQVGDFGFKPHHLWHHVNVDAKKHQINFGNHDDYSFINYSHSLGDFSYAEESELMTIRGAFSIDRHIRTEGLDWWKEEEMNYKEMQKAVDFYLEKKPKIVISHDAPHSVRERYFKIKDKSLTTNGLQVMFEQYQPELWIFGHHHKSLSRVYKNTHFICLSELEVFEF